MGTEIQLNTAVAAADMRAEPDPPRREISQAISGNPEPSASEELGAPQSLEKTANVAFPNS
jgi:hypothetical protein